jgi:hypothetical protein
VADGGGRDDPFLATGDRLAQHLRHDEAFYLRVHGVGEYRYAGADIGILVTRERMQTDARELLDRGANWAKALGSQFGGEPPAGRIVTPQEQLYAKWF